MDNTRQGDATLPSKRKRELYVPIQDELKSLSDALISKREQFITLRVSVLSAQKISGMPRSSKSDNFRKIDNRVNRADILRRDIRRLENEINQRISVIDENREFIRDAESKIYLLQSRYLEGREWPEIMNALYGKEADFKQRENTYRRKMYRLHQTACFDVWKFWDVRSRRDAQKMV